MSGFSFATCDRKSALRFIKEVYSRHDVTEDMCSDVLDLVETDIIRVEDPMMHGSQIQVIPGKKHGSFDGTDEDIINLCQVMVSRITGG